MSGLIRFCDKEVYAIQLNDYTRSQLIVFFLDNHFQSIITIYDENEWVGSISYKDILTYGELNEAICRDTVCLDESVFEKAHEILDKHVHQYLPVFNKSGELDCFCYLDEAIGEETDALAELERTIDGSYWIQDIYPDVEVVWICGVNEYAYKFYLMCERRKMPVCLWDEKWKLLNDFDKLNNESVENYPDYAVMRIYAEGTGRSIEESFAIFKILKSQGMNGSISYMG